MMAVSLRDAVTDLVNREAMLIDDKRFDEWIELYAEDCLLWMPAWQSESEVTDNPHGALNLLYLTPRTRLEDRVFRLESGDSFASTPMDRTVHIVSNVQITAEREKEVDVRAHWLVHSYGVHGGITRGGRYEYVMRREGDTLKIAKKKIIMINDKLVGAVDIYHI